MTTETYRFAVEEILPTQHTSLSTPVKFEAFGTGAAARFSESSIRWRYVSSACVAIQPQSMTEQVIASIDRRNLTGFTQYLIWQGYQEQLEGRT